jgi:hypothetical protein
MNSLRSIEALREGWGEYPLFYREFQLVARRMDLGAIWPIEYQSGELKA